MLEETHTDHELRVGALEEAVGNLIDRIDRLEVAACDADRTGEVLARLVVGLSRTVEDAYKD